MGLTTVVVLSEADRDAMHVDLADEAVLIGPAPAKDSYLHIEAIIDAAHDRRRGDPSRLRLSENCRFRAGLRRSGAGLVGPSAAHHPPDGFKSAAKSLMESSGVPVVPATTARIRVPGAAVGRRCMGYPVLVKASAGGGGRGMRVVGSADELAEVVASAKREAGAAFGNDQVLIEKYVAKPRHIEVQVLLTPTAMWCRCSSANARFSAAIRKWWRRRWRSASRPSEAPRWRRPRGRRQGRRLCRRWHRRVHRRCERVLFHRDEHASAGRTSVTEMITGLDLVEWQLRVAFGEPLPLRQDEIMARGHAIEARIYAEDADKGFLPATGVIREWREPAARASASTPPSGGRCGHALLRRAAGEADRMGRRSPQALDRMVEALGGFEIAGVSSISRSSKRC